MISGGHICTFVLWYFRNDLYRIVCPGGSNQSLCQERAVLWRRIWPAGYTAGGHNSWRSLDFLVLLWCGWYERRWESVARRKNWQDWTLETCIAYPDFDRLRQPLWKNSLQRQEKIQSLFPGSPAGKGGGWRGSGPACSTL